MCRLRRLWTGRLSDRAIEQFDWQSASGSNGGISGLFTLSRLHNRTVEAEQLRAGQGSQRSSSCAPTSPRCTEDCWRSRLASVNLGSRRMCWHALEHAQQGSSRRFGAISSQSACFHHATIEPRLRSMARGQIMRMANRAQAHLGDTSTAKRSRRHSRPIARGWLRLGHMHAGDGDNARTLILCNVRSLRETGKCDETLRWCIDRCRALYGALNNDC